MKYHKIINNDTVTVLQSQDEAFISCVFTRQTADIQFKREKTATEELKPQNIWHFCFVIHRQAAAIFLLIQYTVNKTMFFHYIHLLSVFVYLHMN